MRTTLNLPDDLIRRAQKAAGAKTKTETILKGLELIIRRDGLEKLRGLRGRLPLAVDIGKARERFKAA
jgi:hypothetical protein